VFQVGYWSFENNADLNQEATLWEQSTSTYGIAENATNLSKENNDSDTEVAELCPSANYNNVAELSGEAVLWEPSAWTYCTSVESTSFRDAPGMRELRDLGGDAYEGICTPEEHFDLYPYAQNTQMEVSGSC